MAHGMVYDMSDARSGQAYAITAASHVAAKWSRVKEALGVRTQEEAAAKIGMPLRTFQRFLTNPDSTTLRNARLVSHATGISVDDLSATEPALAEVG